MSLQALVPLLARTEEFSGALNALENQGSRSSLIVPDSATAYAIATAWQSCSRPVFTVTPNPESARRLADQLAVWCGDDAPVLQFGETENIPFERYVPDFASTHLRLQALSALAAWKATAARDTAGPRNGRAPATPPLAVASVQAVSQATLAAALFARVTHAVSVKQRYNLDELVRRWVAMGYRVEPTVDIPGTISRRGGILDIFPMSLDLPVRIEFFDDEVESIRPFNPETQRSVKPAGKSKAAARDLASVLVVPADEVLPAQASEDDVMRTLRELDFDKCTPETATRISSEVARVLKNELPDELTFYAGFFCSGSVFEYVPDDALLIVLRPGAVEEAARGVDSRLGELRRTKEQRGDVPVRFPQPNFDWGRVADGLNSRRLRRLDVTPWGVEADEAGSSGRIFPGAGIRLPVSPQPPLAPMQPVVTGETNGLPASPDDSIVRAVDALARARSVGLRTLVISNHAERLSEMAADRGVDAKAVESLTVAPAPGEVVMVQGHLREGFVLQPSGDVAGLSLLTDREVFGVSKERRRIRKRPMRRGPALEELKPGTYVVHIEHGIARFAGTTALTGQDKEFLVLEYAEDDKLYVPTEHLDRIQLYRSPDDEPPKLTRLGTQEWSKARERAKRATEQLAGELVALYAARQLVEGFATGSDTPWQDALEASFPYEETADQMATIDAVKKDLEAARPMDRLVCGDVGFGKTEVALRAAFKVVQSGRQVAVLVPTTVLAQQHFNTFTERLKPFPVRVAVLSRFLSDAEQKAVARNISSGEVDICVGTHRMLQRDVAFKDLGLVVIDEEHKFGVVHKERLKRMRSQVDVLTLSATPIPRTLNLSLAGVRDMSTIQTPPEERLPIKTYVSEESDELVREALLRELDRGGQAFVLHNRVKDIEEFTARIQKLVPEASVEIGHGQMAEDELEEVMARFANRDADILVCTTIIESGLDLPNVNTLVIDRADMFGLSQLYQLRGRIGRGTNRAYAYLLVPRGKQLTDAAEQRLETILAAAELGAGYEIAMRDLEIRGMGNVVGAEQSGHVAAVGFDMYTKLLADAVADLKAAQAGGQPDAKLRVPDFSTVRVDLGVDARVPDSFIEDLAQRLAVYQRLVRIRSVDEIRDLRDELRDRYGPVPKHIDLLLLATKMRVLAERTNVDSVITSSDKAVLTLREPTGGARTALQRHLGRGVDVGHMQIRVEIDREDDEWIEELAAVLEQIETFRERALKAMAAAVR